MGKEKQSYGSTNSEFLDDGGLCEFSSDESFMDDSSNSGASSVSSSDCVEDASSSSTSSSSVSLLNGHGPLYELSDLMAHLPIKKGLSKFYDGKSQSFTSLASVMSIDDLAKKEIPFGRKLKLCKSYGGNLNAHKSSYSPKATISKKASKGSFFSNSLGKKGASVGGCRHPINSNPNSPRFSRPDDA